MFEQNRILKYGSREGRFATYCHRPTSHPSLRNVNLLLKTFYIPVSSVVQCCAQVGMSLLGLQAWLNRFLKKTKHVAHAVATMTCDITGDESLLKFPQN